MYGSTTGRVDCEAWDRSCAMEYTVILPRNVLILEEHRGRLFSYGVVQHGATELHFSLIYPDVQPLLVLTGPLLWYWTPISLLRGFTS